MDNSRDKTKHNMNTAGGSRQFHPDLIEQARDGYSRANKGLQPIEIVESVNKPISVANATLLPNQFIGTGESTQASQSGDNILKSIFRFKWMILAICVLVAAPMIAAIWIQIVPEYRARAEIRVRPIIPFLVFRTEDNGMIPLYSSFVNTQVSIIKGMTVLQRVLEQEEVQETQWYKKSPKSLVQRVLGNPPATHIERLMKNLSVRPRAGTEIVDIAFTYSSAKDAEIIVDTVLNQYINYFGEMSDTTKDKLYSKLQDQYISLDNEIKGQEVFSAQLSKSLGTGTPAELISRKRVRLDGTQARINELQQNIAILEWEQKKLDDLMKQASDYDSNNVSVDSTDTMEKQPKYYEDPQWRALEANVRTKRHEIANSLLTTKHPVMVRLEKDLKFAEESLGMREEQLDEQWRGLKKNASDVPITTIHANANGLSYEEELRILERQLARTQYEIQLLLTEYKQQQTEFDELFENAQLLEKENIALLHKRELFAAVRQRLDQKTMERNVPGSIEMLAEASAPSKPYNDRRIVLTAMAMFLGLGIGGGVSYLRAGKNQTIYAPNDMPHPMQVPFLGYIPVIRTRRSSGDKVDPTMIESIRFVRTALLSRLDGQSNTAVLITSADAGTGKSTFTTVLGKSLAQASKKVLMIDADFRKMSLTEQFNLFGKPGFLESLYHKSVDKRHIFPTETFGLSIIPTGKRENESMVFEETANGAFHACISQLRRQYDIILLDCSPIMPVADATILSSQVDGTIMVERELVSRRENVIKALARLDSSGGRLLGTVFVGSGGYEGYGYKYNYSRTSES